MNHLATYLACLAISVVVPIMVASFYFFVLGIEVSERRR